MKRILYSMLFVLLMIFGATNLCFAAEEEPFLIFRNATFEEHREGEKPSAFSWHEYNVSYDADLQQYNGARDNTEIVKIEKNGNSENLAVKFNADKDNDGYTANARAVFNHYPIKGKGVISFSFRVDDLTTDKVTLLNGNVNKSRYLRWLDNKALFNFIKTKGNKVYYNASTLIGENIQVDTWYRIDFAFDVESKKATVYFDGKPTSVTLPENIVNISEVDFWLPVTLNDKDSSWYIDDLRIYEADEVLDDAVVDAAWKKYTDSSFYLGYEFQAGPASRYNYMAFLRCSGKRYAVVNSTKFFDGSKVIDLPAKIYYEGKELMVPIRAISELYGAEVDWNDAAGRAIVRYNGKTIEVAPGENIYYINGAPAKLQYPVTLVDGSTCMQIDVFFDFLDKTYSLENNILWFDEPNKFDWYWPVDIDTGVEILNSNSYGSLTLQECIDDRILKTILYDRPSDEEIDNAVKKGVHPRIEFTKESVAEIKANIETDPKLKMVVENLIGTAKKTIGANLAVWELHDGKRAAYNNEIYMNFNNLAAGYLFSESEEDKAAFKAEILRHLNHLDTFPSFHFEANSALGTGTAAYGFAYAYDWIDWTDEERKLIEDMCKRNILDHALHMYNCTMWQNGHIIGDSVGNQALITNGGILLLAISMYESDPEYMKDVIRGALRATEGGTIVYFPHGEYEEGISYWRYASDYLPRVLKGMQTSMDTDWGITDVPGILETSQFPIGMRGAVSAYAFGDGSAEDAIVSLMMFCADQLGNKAIAQYRKDKMGQSGTTVDVANWVYDTESYKQGLDTYDHDIYNENNATLIMKTGWNTADTTVAFHGGGVSDPHGHTDVGAFQFDMNGVRFAMDLPREDYNLRDMGHYNAARINEFWPDGYNFGAGHYYRVKAEGHNTVVVNRQETNSKTPIGYSGIKTYPTFDMYRPAQSTFIEKELTETTSFALLEMTETNKILESAIRGVKLDKINNIIEIQDDFTAIKPTDFMWSMHTQAEIEISEDGKTAILEQNNTKIKATILNDCDFKFEVLPAAFDETYGTSMKPPFESPNTVYTKNDPYYLTHGKASDVGKDVRKLAVRTQKGQDITHFKLAVAFQPYIEGSTIKPEYVSLELWENKDINKQTLASVNVDGKPLETFDPNKTNYSIRVVTEKSEVPEITAVATSPSVDVEVIKATTVPGLTNIALKQKGETVGLYFFLIEPINYTTKFHSDKQLPIFDYSVTSEPQNQNGVANLFDGDFETKFATDEQGGAVVMDLGSIIEGNLKLNVSFLEGDKRFEYLKIEYSEDGSVYHEVFNGSNSGTTTQLQQFDIANKAQYVKVSFYGSSQGAWVSVTEMFVSNE